MRDGILIKWNRGLVLCTCRAIKPIPTPRYRPVIYQVT